jgi:hypothetical protein
MALVDPNIALSYRGLQLQDPLDQYSKASAAQLNALKMDELMQEREALNQIRSAITAKGGPPDLEAAAQAMVSTGRPQFVQSGMAILEKLQNQKNYEQYRRDIEGAPAPAPASANALAPSEPPVNAMTAPGAAAAAPVVSPQTQELMNRIRRVSQLGEAGKPEAAILKMQLENQLRVEAAENATPSDLIMMKRLGFELTKEGLEQYRNAQRTPPPPQPLVPVLENGKPVLRTREQAAGQTPFTPATVQIMGLGPGKEAPAPSVTQIQDPTDPTQMITINARDYKGGGLGSPGVIGLAGKTPAATAAATKKEEGKQQASDILDTLETAYTELDRRKAVPSERRSAGSNILAYVAGTGAGQIAGRVVGTEAQTQRDIIQSSRNQLLNAVKNATGMSAQQLNSNVEFRSWLEALSDPTRSIEANRAILENMRKFIANNAKKAEAPASKPSPAPAPSGAKADPLGIR